MGNKVNWEIFAPSNRRLTHFKPCLVARNRKIGVLFAPFITVVKHLRGRMIEAALSLAWEVFSEYESPDYSQKGTEEFRKCLQDEMYLDGIDYYGAFDGCMLVGIVGIRKEKCHICFFFVDGKYHRLGIGTKLFERLKAEYPGKTITLNSSPYGLAFYQSLGFHKTDSEQTVNGIRFTPMIYRG